MHRDLRIPGTLPPDPTVDIDIAEPADLIDPYPPMSWGPLPIIIALVLLGLILLWYAWLLLARYLRSRPERSTEPEPAAAPIWVDPRMAAMARIEEIEQAGIAGRISERSAHQQLSEVVREYVSTVSGLPTTRMTLFDLREANLAQVAAAVERTYPPAFGAEGEGDVAQTAAVAREVVGRWN